ncbi:hypothetical protein GCM10020000_62850 [Streptomyces olivoverticillatus]
MTAAVVVLAVGGSLTPTGSVEAFGLTGAGAHTTVDIAPLGVSLVGALLLGRVFARSLRPLGPMVRGRELAARAAAVAVLFLLLLGGLAWAGSSTITFDGSGLNPSGSGGGQGGLNIPGVGDVGNIGGGLPDRLAGLAGAKASVGFSVRTGPSLLGGAVWVLAVLLITVLAARRAPLPRSWQAAHRTVRPAASALCTVLVLAVVAGLAAAAGAATADDHPGRVLGGALLGAPNGVWLGGGAGAVRALPGDGRRVAAESAAGSAARAAAGRDGAGGHRGLARRDGAAGVAAASGVRADDAHGRGADRGPDAAGAGRCGGVRPAARGGPRGGHGPGPAAAGAGHARHGGREPVGAGRRRLRGGAEAERERGGGAAAGPRMGIRGRGGRGLLVCAVRPREAGEVRPYPVAGPYSPSAGYRPAREESNPYLRQPGQVDPYTAPTETGPMPPPRPRRPGYRYGSSPVPPPDELPPPPRHRLGGRG